MQNLYLLLISKDEKSKNLGKQIFDNLCEKDLDDFIEYYLNHPFTNKISRCVRAKIANRLSIKK